MDDEVQWRRRREDYLRLRVRSCVMIYLVDLSNPHGTVTVFLRTMRMSLVMAPQGRRSSTRVRPCMMISPISLTYLIHMGPSQFEDDEDEPNGGAPRR